MGRKGPARSRSARIARDALGTLAGVGVNRRLQYTRDRRDAYPPELTGLVVIAELTNGLLVGERLEFRRATRGHPLWVAFGR